MLIAQNEIEEAYRSWLSSRPEVFALFEKFALQMLERKRRFGIGMLTERVRWEVATDWAFEKGFKINNNYRAYIARDLIAKYPEMGKLIETRAVKTKE